MSERKSNTEFVTNLMEFSPSGAIAQLVILTAIEKYVNQCILQERELVKSMANGFISGEAWVEACKDIKCQIDTRYE